MAIFGDVGKFLGLGTAKQTLTAATQGALRGAILGQPFMGAASGALTAGTQQGQATAVAVPQAPPSETAFSGETVTVRQPVMQPSPISYSPGIQPAIMRTPMPPSRAQATQAGLPAIIGGGAVAEQMGVDVEVIVYIMTKRMRNDGPYVTKAAVRKTKATVRKMKNLCDMYEDLRPAARRRAPARKTTSTRITNVK